MKTTKKGTAKYIVGEVSRFDQKNEMFKRVRWQPELREMSRKLFGLVYPKDKDGHTLLVRMDDLFGYGKQVKADKYWAD